MKKRLPIKTYRSLSDETGAALIIVLVFLLLGSLTIIPVLSHLHTALETGEIYEDKAMVLYTADAGIEDGLWRIKYDFMGGDYDPYDFDTAWPYETDTLNGMVANVTIKNVWLPSNVTLDDLSLSPDDAKSIIESEKLVVVGTSGAIPGQPYHIKIDYTPAAGDNLTIKSLGVWLPQGFEYADNCSLTHDGSSTPYYPDSENITNNNGGQTIVWGYNPPYPLFTDFPDVDPEAITMTIDFTFSYTPPSEHPNYLPTAIAWITTLMTDSLGNPVPNPNDPVNVPISWDMDTRIYEITSSAGDTEIQAYSSKCELRQMGDAMSGDYVAIGNSLLANDDPWDDRYRETWYTPSTVTLDSIPADADAVAAYLYWTGWRNEYSKQAVLSDDCSSFSPNWDPDPTSCWDDSLSYFRSDYDDGEDRELPMDSSITIPLAQYKDTPAVVSVAWWHWETGSVEPSDGLDFAISANDGATWSDYIPAFRGTMNGPPSFDYYEDVQRFEYDIPNEYLTNDFKLKFKLVGFEGGNDGDCCIEGFDIKVMLPDTDVIFKIGNGTDEYQVYFYNGEPTSGSGNLTAGRSYVMRDTMWDKPYGYSYACVQDVSALVKKYPIVDGEEHHTGNAIYTIDGVEADNGLEPSTSDDSHFAFAGWSLIIVYASPQTAGHYIYIRDDNFAFHPGTGGNLDFDEDGEPGGDITNFVVPEPITDKYGIVTENVSAKLTCFIVEGDNSGTSSITITGQQSQDSLSLSNPQSPASDVWNGKSYPGTVKEGVDIDTFELLWSDNILTPGDNVLTVDLPSLNDAWNLVYFIISIRSETVTGGTSHYVIYNS